MVAVEILIMMISKILMWRQKSSRIDYSSKAIENENGFNLYLKISMIRESRMI